MDTKLARTFLAVAETGSFIDAANRLSISQTTVTARIRSLESQLGQSLFNRGRHGATLTPQGDRFMSSALSILQIWERARHDVNVPGNQQHVLSVGGELSLWNPLLLNWLVWMRRHCPDIALRTEVEDAASLIGKVERETSTMSTLTGAPNFPSSTTRPFRTLKAQAFSWGWGLLVSVTYCRRAVPAISASEGLMRC